MWSRGDVPAEGARGRSSLRSMPGSGAALLHIQASRHGRRDTRTSTFKTQSTTGDFLVGKAKVVHANSLILILPCMHAASMC